MSIYKPTPATAALVIANAKAGDTIAPPKDTYNLANVIVPSGVTLDLSADPTIIAPNQNAAFRYRDGSSCTLTGGLFRGAACYFEGKAILAVTGIDVTAFDNGPDMGYGPGGFGGPGADLSGTISGHNFHDSPNGRAVNFFTNHNLTIDSGQFVNTFLGIKSNNSNRVRAVGLWVTKNKFFGQSYHCCEFQGCIDGSHVNGNTFDKQNPVNAASHFGISFQYTPGRAGDPGGALPSTDQHFLDNTLNGPVDANGVAILPLGAELGQMMDCQRNRITNFQLGATLWYGIAAFKTNHIAGWTIAMAQALPNAPGIYIQPSADNGPTVVINAPPPVDTPPNNPTMNLSITSKPAPNVKGTVTAAWSNLPTGTASLKLYAQATGDANQNTDNLAIKGHAGPQFTTTNISAGSADIDGYHTGWKFAFILTAQAANGIKIASSSAVADVAGESATEPWPPSVVTPPPAKPRSVKTIIYDDGTSQAVGP